MNNFFIDISLGVTILIAVTGFICFILGEFILSSALLATAAIASNVDTFETSDN